MAATRAGVSLPSMLRADDSVDLGLATAWAGALSAARDEIVAQDAVTAACQALGVAADPVALRRRAVRVALELGAAEAFAGLSCEQRCALGLARLAGADLDDIAAELGCARDEAAGLLTGALRGLARWRTRLAPVA